MNRLSRIGRILILGVPLWLLAACGASSTSIDSVVGGTNGIAGPTNLQAVAQDARVVLTWSPVANANLYHVKRATVAGSYTQIAAPTATSYADTAVTNGVTYYYVVTAVVGATETSASPMASAEPNAPVALAAAPTGLAAAAGNAQISLTWNASAGAAYYDVERALVSGGPYSLVATPTGLSYVDTGLTNGTPYFYVVAAVDEAGTSAYSAQASATPVAPVPPLVIPSAPSGLEAAAGISVVDLVWVASSPATSYTVSRSTTSGGPYTQVATTTAGAYADTNIVNGTTYYYVVSGADSAGTSPNSVQVSATPIAPDVTVTVNPGVTHAISPYIYGINNFTQVTGAPAALTLDRSGGNAWTTYNWETNYSNDGDVYNGFPYNYYNGDNLSSSTTPGAAVSSAIGTDHTNGMASLVTFQLQGLVAADDSGLVDVSNPPTSDANRFDTVVYQKSTQSNVPFTTSPNLNDNYVYMDEFAYALDQNFTGQNIFGASPSAKPTFAELDDEPELWNSAAYEVQGPTIEDPNTYITKSIALAKALKTEFPNMVIFGPVHEGFGGIYSWENTLSNNFSSSCSPHCWFPDLYLPAIQSASATFGRPLIDVYDFHWYSQAQYDSSGNSITTLTGSTLTQAQIQAIVQSPRSLWDPTYTENSYITQLLGGPIDILGQLQSRINAENPGMKIAISDYQNGGYTHIAGTLAQADNLGIFGAQGVFAASLSSATSGPQPYTLGGFRAFRNFDGANSNFGDTSVQATSSNIQHVSAYVSTDSTHSGRVVLVLINRSFSSQVVAVNGQTLTGTAHVYQMTASSAAAQSAVSSAVQPVAAGTQPVGGSLVAFTLPALSVTTVDIH